MRKADSGSSAPAMALSLFFASASIALAALSIANFRSDQAPRLRTQAFCTRFNLDLRRPLETESIDLAPSGDWTAAIAADAALSDATESVALSNLSPHLKKLWLESAAETGEELSSAEDLVAAAVEGRPGWGIYRYLL